MVLTRTESTWYNINSSFGETIDKFQDCNIKKKHKYSWKNKEKNLKTRIRSNLIKPVYMCVYIYREREREMEINLILCKYGTWKKTRYSEDAFISIYLVISYFICTSLYPYIYIYIYNNTEIKTTYCCLEF